MAFAATKTVIKMIKESAFGGTYIRDIYFVVNEKWCRMSW